MQWLGREVTWEEKGVFRAKEMFLFEVKRVDITPFDSLLSIGLGF